MYCDRCPKCGRPAQLIERNSRAFDPNRAGIGSSARLGARYNTLLTVPQAPTEQRTERYLFQLSALDVPQGMLLALTSLWQLLYLGAYPEVYTHDPADTVKEWQPLRVTDPAFAFPDGNTSWAMSWYPGGNSNDALYDPAAPPGCYPGLHAPESGLLYIPPFSPRYTPPNAGDPGGEAVGSLTGFTDARFTSSGGNLGIGYQIPGPGTLAFTVSLWQTNPATRRIWKPGGTPDFGAFPQESRFIWQMDLNAELGNDAKARYTHVAGGFTAQMRPMCCELPWRGVREIDLSRGRIIEPGSRPAPHAERPS